MDNFQEFFTETLSDFKNDFDSCRFWIDNCCNDILEIAIFCFNSNQKKQRRKKSEEYCVGIYVIEKWTCRQLWEAIKFMQDRCSEESVKFSQSLFVFSARPT